MENELKKSLWKKCLAIKSYKDLQNLEWHYDYDEEATQFINLANTFIHSAKKIMASQKQLKDKFKFDVLKTINNEQTKSIKSYCYTHYN